MLDRIMHYLFDTLIVYGAQNDFNFEIKILDYGKERND